MLSTLLLGVALELAPAAKYKIVAQCGDPNAEVRAVVDQYSALEVDHAIGGETTCYAVTADLDGKRVSGYVVGRGLYAIEAFERARTEATAKSVFAVTAPALQEPPVHPAMSAPAGEAPAANAPKKDVHTRALPKPPKVEM